jgi:hypothetical protein
MSRTASASSALCAALVVVAGAPARADDAALPAKLQAALFRKILAYDRALAGGQAKVAVVSGGDDGAAGEMVSAFKDAGVDAALVKPGELEKSASNAVYAMQGAPAGKVSAACAKLKALSLAGEAAGVESGTVAVGLVAGDDGRPEIVVHLARVKQEGHELAAELLKHARVIH